MARNEHLGQGYDPYEPVGAPGGPPDPELGTGIPAFTYSDSLSAFMIGVREWYGNNYGGSVGAYGISADRWNTMATGAGLQGSNREDPHQQDYVAGYWMNKWYQKYQNWTLVAVAWRHGTGAANSLVKQTQKDPRLINQSDVEQFFPDGSSFVAAVTSDTAKLIERGYESGFTLDEQPMAGGPSVVITGSANAQPTDPFYATILQLQGEIEAEEKQRQPSPAEMLFSQLDRLSGVVMGGEERVDWRTDYGEIAGAGGEAGELPPMERQGGEDNAIR